MRRLVTAAASLIVLVALVAVAAAKGSPKEPIPFEDATMIVEVNDTDGDAGLQVFLDGEPWRSLRIDAPDGRKILEVKANGALKNFGLTELFSESNEPPFDEVPLEEFKERFPEGEYAFSGRTIEGRRLLGSATLSHDIPDGPEVTSPADDATVDPTSDVVVEWEPVTTPAGVEIVGYQVIVEREDPLRTFEVELPATATSVTVPPEFLEADTEYGLEVLAIEASGNQTITEQGFTTAE